MTKDIRYWQKIFKGKLKTLNRVGDILKHKYEKMEI